jgi:predicted  nucleic acid-binding Zn-ribbon protein
MKDERLFRLFQLHRIDEKLLAIKSQAEHLDQGRKESAGIKKLQTDYATELEQYKTLKTKISEKKTASAVATEKIAKFSAQLYDSNSSSKELANLQKEIDMLEELGLQIETNIEELEAEFKPLHAKVTKINAKITELRTTIDEKKAAAVTKHEELKTAFKTVGAQRAAAEAAVELALLKSYNAARAKTGSTGLALVTASNRCAGCGIDVPEKVRDLIYTGRTQPCESCGRILFIHAEALE